MDKGSWRRRGDSQPAPRGETSFDELAKGLASRSISRRKAVRWMGGALLGSVLAIVPGVEAFAAPKPPKGRCQAGFVNCRGTCVKIESNPSHCGGCFTQCSPNEVCTSGQCCVPERICGGSQCCGADESCCDCGDGSPVCCPSGTYCAGCGPTGSICCQSGEAVCGGQCFSTTCPEGKFFNTSTCQCEERICSGSQNACDNPFFCGPSEFGDCICFLTAAGPHQCFQLSPCGGPCVNDSDCGPGFACAENCCGRVCYPLCGTPPTTTTSQDLQGTGVRSG
jgi:Stigma-specific protein, Stig1